MPKLYYLTPDELQGATLLNENTWMREYQALMLGLANTSEGKDLLLIHDHGLPVIGIRKNAVLYDQGGGQLMADFRIGAKWGNLVRARWREVRSALERINELQILGRSQSYRGYPVPAGAASLAVVPDPHVEDTSMDGYAGATYNLNTAWSTVLAEGGGNSDANAATIAVYTACYSVSTQWANMSIGFFLFDTSPLTASAVISAATVDFRFNLKSDEFAQAGSIALVQTTTASNTSIANGDYGAGPFDRVGTDADVAIADITTDSSTPSRFTLSSGGRGNIATTGITKLGVQTAHFTDNSEPTWLSNKRHSVTIRSAEYASSVEPTLTVTYTLAFTPRAIMF